MSVSSDRIIQKYSPNISFSEVRLAVVLRAWGNLPSIIHCDVFSFQILGSILSIRFSRRQSNAWGRRRRTVDARASQVARDTDQALSQIATEASQEGKTSHYVFLCWCSSHSSLEGEAIWKHQVWDKGVQYGRLVYRPQGDEQDEGISDHPDWRKIEREKRKMRVLGSFQVFFHEFSTCHLWWCDGLLEFPNPPQPFVSISSWLSFITLSNLAIPRLERHQGQLQPQGAFIRETNVWHLGHLVRISITIVCLLEHVSIRTFKVWHLEEISIRDWT